MMRGMGPLIYRTRDENKTIQQHTSDCHPVMAASICSLVPVIIVFLFLRRYFIGGIAMTGIEG